MRLPARSGSQTVVIGTTGTIVHCKDVFEGDQMNNRLLLRALVAIAIIGGGLYVIIQDDPATPEGDIKNIHPFAEQSGPAG